jgi:hypothetical protein
VIGVGEAGEVIHGVKHTSVDVLMSWWVPISVSSWQMNSSLRPGVRKTAAAVCVIRGMTVSAGARGTNGQPSGFVDEQRRLGCQNRTVAYQAAQHVRCRLNVVSCYGGTVYAVEEFRLVIAGDFRYM